MATTTNKTESFLEVSIKLRKATSHDFRKEITKNNNGSIEISYEPKYGQPYWVKSIKTSQLDNRNYQITEDTDWEELKQYIRLEMLYVPVSFFELKDAES